MENYIMNKILIVLIAVSLLAFGIQFYGRIPSVWIVIIMLLGYVGLGVIGWLNERKYRKEKKVYRDKKLRK